MLTKRGFLVVLFTIGAFQLAMGLPKMAARRWVAEESGVKNLVGSAGLQAAA
jgi:hypothetical protein